MAQPQLQALFERELLTRIHEREDREAQRAELGTGFLTEHGDPTSAMVNTRLDNHRQRTKLATHLSNAFPAYVIALLRDPSLSEERALPVNERGAATRRRNSRRLRQSSKDAKHSFLRGALAAEQLRVALLERLEQLGVRDPSSGEPSSGDSSNGEEAQLTLDRLKAVLQNPDADPARTLAVLRANIRPDAEPRQHVGSDTLLQLQVEFENTLAYERRELDLVDEIRAEHGRATVTPDDVLEPVSAQRFARIMTS